MTKTFLERTVLERLKELAKMENKKEAHSRADGVVIGMLAALGYTDIVNAYENVTRCSDWGKRHE